MQLAILADLHLTGTPGSVKRLALDWALADLRARGVAAIVAIGDLTATGTAAQADEVLAALAATGLPFCSTPGNAEWRTDRTGDVAARFDVPPAEGLPLVLVDSANGTPDDTECRRLAALPDGAGALLATHVPPASWNAAANELLADARRRGAVAAVIAGHTHDDRVDALRGLDPDKASGGPPMYAILDNDGGPWRRSDRVMPGVAPAEWPAAERGALHAMLGVSTMWTPVESIREAARLGIPHLELRYGAVAGNPDGLREALAEWRAAGGKCLSMHLPNLTPGDDGGGLAAAVQLTLDLGCARATLHVPKVTAAAFPAARADLIDRFRAIADRLPAAGVEIGIENLHTTPGATDDAHRNYGCTIEECRAWIEDLRAVSAAPDRIGFHLDLGHARNNAPFSATENLSDYYRRLGSFVNGYHFHQVRQNHDGTFSNHRRLNGLHDKLISLSGFLLALREGQLPHAPIFLEINEDNAGIECWQKLTQAIG